LQTLAMACIPEKKVLVFGRTGDGKSTLANMLVAGTLRNPRFKIGDGMAGVTVECEVGHGRNYAVIDTVGLGEETEGEALDPTNLIYNFLKRTRGEYSHILFVKAAGRLDKLDKEIWRIFLEVFKGAEPAFAVVVTKCPNAVKWSADNKEPLENMYRECQGRFAFVDFPPVNARPDTEAALEEDRQQSLQRLDATLDSLFRKNSLQYYKPEYAELDDSSLRKRAKEIFKFVLAIAKALASNEILKAILGLFVPGANIAMELLNRILQNSAS
jgi:hypothetical protein